MFKSIKTKSKKAGAAIGTTIKVLTAVVCGALVMTGTYGVVKTAVLPTTTTKMESMFEYEGSGGSGGGSGGDSPIYSPKVNGQTTDASAANYMPYFDITPEGVLSYNGDGFTGTTIEVPDSLDGIDVKALNIISGYSDSAYYWKCSVCGSSYPYQPIFEYNGGKCLSGCENATFTKDEEQGPSGNPTAMTWPTISRLPESVDTFLADDWMMAPSFTIDGSVKYSDKSTVGITAINITLVPTHKGGDEWYSWDEFTPPNSGLGINSLSAKENLYFCLIGETATWNNIPTDGTLSFNGSLEELVFSLSRMNLSVNNLKIKMTSSGRAQVYGDSPDEAFGARMMGIYGSNWQGTLAYDDSVVTKHGNDGEIEYENYVIVNVNRSSVKIVEVN